MARAVDAVILAGGEGKRMGTQVPKVLLDLFGRPVIGHVLDALAPLATRRKVVIGGRHLPTMRKALGEEEGVRFAKQAKPLGTAHAVKQALKELPQRGSDVFILCGDVPLIDPASLEQALATHREQGAEVTVLTAVVRDPHGLGRIVRDEAGRCQSIVEERDATDEERRITEINTGAFVVKVEALHRLIPLIDRNNAQREYYLTDLVRLAKKGKVAASAVLDPDEARGINRPPEWLEVRRLMKARLLFELAKAGATVVDPDLTYVEKGVCVGEGVLVHPFVVLRRGVTLAPFSSVGPFAHLRAGTVVGEGASVGDFVEAKEAVLGANARALHHAYLGDAEIGADVNVGAGTITANFDGRTKHRTVVGDGASLGAGTVLVAPVTVGPGARTGAGAVVTAETGLGANELAVGVPARVVKTNRKAAKASGQSSKKGRRKSRGT